MVEEICERVRGSQATELRDRTQSAGDLQPNAEAKGVGRRSRDQSKWAEDRNDWATDRLLELLVEHHSSPAPLDVLTQGGPAPEPAAPEAPVEMEPPLKRVRTLNPVRTIMKATALHFGFTLAELLSERRTKDIVRARHVAMYLASRLTVHSLPWIGRQLGGMDHTTILHGVRKIKNGIQFDQALSADVAAVRDIAIGADPALGALA